MILGLSGRIWRWLFHEQGSTRPLGLFRIALVLLLWTRFGPEMTLWMAGDSVQAVFGVAFFILTGFVLIGLYTRRAMALLAAVMALVYFHFGQHLGHIPWTHHHVYLLFISTLITALGPCDRSFSLDRLRRIRTGRAAPETGPLTANRLMILQLAAIYLWTAFDKTNVTFLFGTRLDQILHFHYQGTFAEPLLLWAPLVTAVAVLVVLVEYYLGIAILLGKWIASVMVLGVVLHASFYFLLPVQTFSATMVAMYVFLFRPQAVHVTIDTLIAGSTGGRESRP